MQHIQKLLKKQVERDNSSLSHNPNAWHAFLPNNVLTDIPLHQRRTVS